MWGSGALKQPPCGTEAATVWGSGALKWDLVCCVKEGAMPEIDGL